jgi:SulP family sulfate permease
MLPACGASKGRYSATAMTSPPPSRDFEPKFVTALREGYSLAAFRADAVAGLTVAIVAMPLAMAIGVASGSTPEKGLVTAIVAGFLISALGGSRVQIGGPTAAFIVVVASTIERHGFDGLVLATLMAGTILIVVGALRLGTYVKYIPHPVIVGFTAGIAVSIFLSQVKELLGISAPIPSEFVAKMEALWHALPETKGQTVLVGLLSLAVVIGVKRYVPRIPNMLAAVVFGAVLVAVTGLDAATIATRFGGVPRALPMPELPAFDLAKIRAVLPDAITIALLAGVESLLSAVIADGLTGRRHRPNVELVAQGVANVASALFGGLSATGAIARTATNIRSGARTPVAGMLHAAFLLLFVVLAAPLLAYVPLATLAAILAVVAWNISEKDAILHLMRRAPPGDRFVLVATFVLTVGTDLTIAIQFGVVVSAFLFVHRMAEAVEVREGRIATDDAPTEFERDTVHYRIEGPFFFGASTQVITALERTGPPPKRYVLDFSAVPFVDTTAAEALSGFLDKATKHGAEIVVTGVRSRVREELIEMGLAEGVRFEGE